MSGARGSELQSPPSDSGALRHARTRVLLVPDSIHWITGTIARSFIDYNDWLEGTIISGPVLDVVTRETLTCSTPSISSTSCVHTRHANGWPGCVIRGRW